MSGPRRGRAPKGEGPEGPEPRNMGLSKGQGPEGWSPYGGAVRRGTQVGPEGWEGPTFRGFFPPATISFFLPSLGGLQGCTQ